MHAGVIENRQTGTMTYLFVFYIKRFKVLTECRAKLQLQNSATFFTQDFDFDQRPFFVWF